MGAQDSSLFRTRKPPEQVDLDHQALTVVLADRHGADGDYEAAVVVALFVIAGYVAVSVDSYRRNQTIKPPVRLSTVAEKPTQVVAQMTFDGHILELGHLLGQTGKWKQFETPLLLLFHRRTVRVDLVAERFGRQILVLAVDQSDGVGPHFERFGSVGSFDWFAVFTSLTTSLVYHQFVS